jgi:hypothetical protein
MIRLNRISFGERWGVGRVDGLSGRKCHMRHGHSEGTHAGLRLQKWGLIMRLNHAYRHCMSRHNSHHHNPDHSFDPDCLPRQPVCHPASVGSGLVHLQRLFPVMQTHHEVARSPGQRRQESGLIYGSGCSLLLRVYLLHSIIQDLCSGLADNNSAF